MKDKAEKLLLDIQHGLRQPQQVLVRTKQDFQLLGRVLELLGEMLAEEEVVKDEKEGESEPKKRGGRKAKAVELP